MVESELLSNLTVFHLEQESSLRMYEQFIVYYLQDTNIVLI